MIIKGKWMIVLLILNIIVLFLVYFIYVGNLSYYTDQEDLYEYYLHEKPKEIDLDKAQQELNKIRNVSSKVTKLHYFLFGIFSITLLYLITNIVIRSLKNKI